jgi:hypothetical protein
MAARKQTTKQKGRAAKGRKGGGAGSEVERRWREYWDNRKALESAVTAVRDAQAKLATARDAERGLREKFEATKDSLKQLLEVEPAGGGPRGGARLELPPAPPEPDESGKAKAGPRPRTP